MTLPRGWPTPPPSVVSSGRRRQCCRVVHPVDRHLVDRNAVSLDSASEGFWPSAPSRSPSAAFELHRHGLSGVRTPLNAARRSLSRPLPTSTPATCDRFDAAFFSQRMPTTPRGASALPLSVILPAARTVRSSPRPLVDRDPASHGRRSPFVRATRAELTRLDR